jgi:hypothetical protein
MKTFTVYPKKGEPFSIECGGIKFTGESFILYDEGREPSGVGLSRISDAETAGNPPPESTQGFLSFPDVAAIIPQEPSIKDADYQSYRPVHFEVYLRNRAQPVEGGTGDKPHPIKIVAHAFRVEQPSVIFLAQSKNAFGQVISEWPLGLYVATSEVVAIVPEDGLRRRN